MILSIFFLYFIIFLLYLFIFLSFSFFFSSYILSSFCVILSLYFTYKYGNILSNNCFYISINTSSDNFLSLPDNNLFLSLSIFSNI